MEIHQLRNATIVLTIGVHRLLVDPMLAEPETMPGFRMGVPKTERRRNPLVPLPPGSGASLEEVTGVLLTHEHPDHFDKAALAWVRERDLPVWANKMDVANLRSKGLDARLLEDGALGLGVEVVPSRHGRGMLGWLMGPVAGYVLTHPGEPSLYLTGDSILTENVLEAVSRLQPDVIVAPAGAANVGMGGDILFSVDELVTLVRAAEGTIVLNHLEALDHCPTTRASLRDRMEAEGLLDRVRIPADGEVVNFEKTSEEAVRPRRYALQTGDARRPGFQKWATSWLTGT